MTRILLIGCSASKHHFADPMPAIEFYAGPFYQLIAKAKREKRWPEDIAVGIISAEYGFLEESAPVGPYDHKMDVRRARELQGVIAPQLDAFLLRQHPREVLLAMGFLYRLSLEHSSVLLRLRQRGDVHQVDGAIGKKLQYVKNWLRAAPALPLELPDDRSYFPFHAF